MRQKNSTNEILQMVNPQIKANDYKSKYWYIEGEWSRTNRTTSWFVRLKIWPIKSDFGPKKTVQFLKSFHDRNFSGVELGCIGSGTELKEIAVFFLSRNICAFLHFSFWAFWPFLKFLQHLLSSRHLHYWGFWPKFPSLFRGVPSSFFLNRIHPVFFTSAPGIYSLKPHSSVGFPQIPSYPVKSPQMLLRV